MIYIITFSLWKHLLCILDWCIARWGSKNKHQVYTSLKESGCGPRRPQTTTGYPTMQEEVGGSILGCEISSLLDGKLVGWSTASCALVLACWPSVSKKKKMEKEKEIGLSLHNSLTNLHSIVNIVKGRLYSRRCRSIFQCIRFVDVFLLDILVQHGFEGVKLSIRRWKKTRETNQITPWSELFLLFI